MTLERFLSIYISFFVQPSELLESLFPSLWMLFHPQEDGHLLMVKSFMTCTWKSQEQKLSDCDNSDLSYGGVTNFDINNIYLQERVYDLVVPFVKSYLRFPYCLSTTVHSYGNTSYVLSYISNVGAYATDDKIIFRRRTSKEYYE